jgi:hypothetical protein
MDGKLIGLLLGMADVNTIKAVCDILNNLMATALKSNSIEQKHLGIASSM